MPIKNKVATIIALTASSLMQPSFAQSRTAHGTNNITIQGSGNVVVVNGKVVSGSATMVTASGPNKAEERKVPPYSAIKLEAPADLAYTVNSLPPKLVVHAPVNVLPLLQTRIEAGQLLIYIEGSVSLTEVLRIEASGPPLSALQVSGSGGIDATGLTGKSLRVNVSGSGNVRSAGTVSAVRVDVSGSGGANVSNVTTEELDVSVAGSGNVQAHARTSARVAVSGSGSVQVAGNPARREVEKSGTGQVVFR